MTYRKLRIAWSVAWAILAGLLVEPWVHSYNAFEGIMGSVPGHDVGILSRSGGVGVLVANEYSDRDWTRYTIQPMKVDIPYRRMLGFIEYLKNSEGYRLRLPYPFFMLIGIAFISIPWLPLAKRFSLRTLLIATTLVAVVLGLIVWLL